MDILHQLQKKILDTEEKLLQVVQLLRNANKKIVFTNGCFDLIHRGHVTYLAKAKSLGDILIVALNSDESVRRLKGKERPINSLRDRMFLMASFFFVDYVTFFIEDTPVEVIKKIQPDIHVKGGDYQKENLPEKEVIDAYGGNIAIVPFVNGFSTTNLIHKIRKN